MKRTDESYLSNHTKCALLTHYYGSINYGGVLQAYALCISIIKFSSCEAEQICYPLEDSDNYRFALKKEENRVRYIIKKYTKLFLHLPGKIKTKYFAYKYNATIARYFEERRLAFSHFNQEVIPHSEKTYISDNIAETLSKYDAFITGSDQVWNPNWYTPVFFLDFVPSDKVKISYAASISKDSLTDKEKEVFRKSLADFKAVSVREEQAVDLIKDLSPVKPVVTLDPTLLLDESDWDKVCAPRVVQDDYIFCYFLGDNPKERKIAKRFAKEKGLKLVSVPLTGAKVYSDLKFGDVILLAASPEEFISLIKHASYVFTDSFHAVVFSQIYKRQYFVFNRDSKGSMNSRIINITNLFDTQERFCNGKDKETLKYVQSLEDIDFTRPNKKFEELKEFSINFLKENLA